MQTVDQLRELLLPVFGLDSVDALAPDASLVKDIGADSLDFVEIFYIVERNFNITLSTKEIFLNGQIFKPEELFVDGVVTQEKVEEVLKRFPEAAPRIKVGMTRVQLFSSITTADLAQVIDAKKAGQ